MRTSIIFHNYPQLGAKSLSRLAKESGELEVEDPLSYGSHHALYSTYSYYLL
jgi:hypothetical protein